MISRMSVARQFMLLALLGVVLTIAAVALSLQRSRDLAYESKRIEIENEDSEGASIVRHFVDLEKSGALTREEAQKRAIEAISAIRFAGVNYVALLRYDGLSIYNANKALVGNNILDLKDRYDNPVSRAQIAVAQSGTPGFAEFYFTKIGESTPKRKLSYNIGIPEWQWDVTSGDFADDIDTMVIANAVRLLAIFVPLFVVYLVIVVVMQRGLAKVLSTLSNTMRRLAQGDLTTEIAPNRRRDELGQMAETLVAFRQAALDKARLETEATATAQRSEQDQRDRERDRMAAAESQADMVQALAGGLEKLSDGDLAYRLAAAFPAHYEKLRTDFNTAMTKLEEALRVVASNTQTIRAGSGEISTAADDLARRTEQQAASLEQTAAALDEITATVRKTAEGATHAHDIVLTAKIEAETSGAVVTHAVQAMGAIERSSDQIGQIIGVIDEIAFQTNLLALNAGVEAARAGEAGRGFAVVASEVRALAQRSATASKEIKALVAESTNHVASGVKLVGETGGALTRIVSQVTKLNHVIAEITSSAAEQAAGLAQVNIAVNQMDQVTQQNAAMVEQTTAASHSLAHETEQLSGLLRRFKIADGAAAITRPARYARTG